MFVIKYDFVLAEDITLGSGCVLEFEGGSISGAYTLTGNNTVIDAKLIKIFNSNVLFDGIWNVPELYPEWFGGSSTNDYATNRTIIWHTIGIMDAIGGGVVYIGKNIKYGGTITSDWNSVVSHDICVVDDSELSTYDNEQGEPTDGVSRDGSQRRLYFLTKGDVYDGQHNGNGLIIAGEHHPYVTVNNTADPTKATARRASIVYAINGVAKWLLGMCPNGITRGPGDVSNRDNEMSNFRLTCNNTNIINIGYNDGFVGFNSEPIHNYVFGDSSLNPNNSFNIAAVTSKDNINLVFKVNTISRLIEFLENGQIKINNKANTSSPFVIDENCGVDIPYLTLTALSNRDANIRFVSSGHARLIDFDRTSGDISITNDNGQFDAIKLSAFGAIFNRGIFDSLNPVQVAVGVTSANRPTQNLYVGLSCFDTTLGKPIWWNGTAWVDATGTPV